ncbi:MAG TPA: M1 family metallopeptidase, partial [Prolixibacteraceae bacterium]|nr:M1 family metallopeptidase [Prolixibacteraceae bacterium]
MRNSFIIYLLLVFISNFVLAQQPNPDILKGIVFSESKNFSLKSGFTENQDYASWDIIYQRLQLEVDPAVRYIKGQITSHFRNKSEDLAQIEFDLHNNLIVDSIYYRNKKTAFTHSANKITIPFETPPAASLTDSVTIFYQGIPPDNENGFGSFSQTMQTGNAVPIIWTLSEPYGAMEWWPCKQSLVDKIDSTDIIVTSPKPYRTASNGILLSETVNNGMRIMHWKHRYPIATYLVAIATTNYVDYTDTLKLDDGRQINILNFVYPQNIELARLKTKATVGIMDLFNRLVGEYPFAAEKYGHAQFGWGGGMEHQTMSFMYNFEFDLVAHELAHQWFGDYITLASWHDIWLNEGFATYMTGLAYENLLDGKWWPVWKKLNMERITSAPGGSVYVPDTTNVSRIFSSRLSYSKGAYLLHMLRWVLGDESFFEGLRNYYNDPEIANGFARHEQFVHHMETAGDTSLISFFNDWYYGEGFPVYSLKY